MVNDDEDNHRDTEKTGVRRVEKEILHRDTEKMRRMKGKENLGKGGD